ncbi:MAG: large subunit ribosomal protein L4 [Rhodospirillaceae bacterium]|nr:MAG: large subunit ribosomal protein L4 [Rhodospirillaceae bacterium]
MRLDVITLDNQVVGSMELADAVFAVEVRTDILHRMVRYQLAKRQAGTHKTKGISDVSGTTKKPFRQKGRGAARQGSLRSPQFRGGAVIFGPVVRSHAHDLQKKVRRLALRCALSAKAQGGQLVVVEDLHVSSPKTRELAERLVTLGWTSTLIVGGAILEEDFVRAVRNIKNITVLPQQGTNVYDILRRDVLVLTREAVQHLEERLK